MVVGENERGGMGTLGSLMAGPASGRTLAIDHPSIHVKRRLLLRDDLKSLGLHFGQ